MLLARFEKKRVQKDGSLTSTIGPLECELAASMVPEPLATRLRVFAAKEDELILAVPVVPVAPGGGCELWLVTAPPRMRIPSARSRTPSSSAS